MRGEGRGASCGVTTELSVGESVRVRQGCKVGSARGSSTRKQIQSDRLIVAVLERDCGGAESVRPLLLSIDAIVGRVSFDSEEGRVDARRSGCASGYVGAARARDLRRE